VPAWPAPGKHRHDQRPGVSRNADRARRQGCLATKEGHRYPVLEEIVVDDKPRNLCPAQRADDAAHATGGRLDHGDQMRVAEVGDTIEYEAGGGPPRDHGHGHALRGNRMPEQVESAHVRGGEDDPLSARVGIVQDGQILDRDRDQRDQLLRGEMLQPEQFAEIPRRHAKDLARLGLEVRAWRLWSQHLSEVGDDVLPVNRCQSDPDIADPIGDTVAHPVREPGDDARHDLGDPDGETIAELPRALASVAFARAAQDALHRGVDRRRRGFVFTRDRYRHNCH
jgi:hypothetical protein